jgi:hypothetical protein
VGYRVWKTTEPEPDEPSRANLTLRPRNWRISRREFGTEIIATEESLLL